MAEVPQLVTTAPSPHSSSYKVCSKSPRFGLPERV
ncbi:Uncharacterised protein [Vibrio cholerae]|nr:Uncharacterised protein [Vibrio cholerae]